MTRESRPRLSDGFLEALRMPRRLLLPYARPTLALVLLVATFPIHAARAQDRGVQDRLDRLERDLSMLQRQLYRNGGSPAGAGSGNAVEGELRMDRLETEMRDLTGRVEDAVNAVEQLRRRLEQINSDIDVRFGQAPGSPPATPPSSSRAAGGGAVTSAVAGTLTSRAAPPSMPPGSVPPPG